MLVASFAGFREDFVGTLGPFIGADRAGRIVTSFETKIRSEAEIGARKAIPDIELAVGQRARQAVKPYVIASLATGVVALAVGGFALYRSWKR
jgi:uncharacterized FAD-dependent dehydrogenase